MELPPFLSEEVWQDWCEYRMTEVGRKQFGPIGKKMFLNRCVKFHEEGYDVPALIYYAADVGWLTIYPKDEFKRKSRPASHNPENKLTLVEKSDKETGNAAIAEMKKAAKRA